MAKRKQLPQEDKLLQQLVTVSDTLFANPFKEQLAALCYRIRPPSDEIEVLLVTSRDSGRWIIPKGWPMKGKKPHQAAATEAWEEAGVKGKVQKKPFGHFTYLKELDNGVRLPCIVHVHILEVSSVDDKFRETGQRRREWVTCSEASRRVREPELKGLFLNLQRQYA
jgi:8-oxo-dGTP pyrophosphatase MutT (NUDIX family)